jgi:glucose/arabinose dehydrogenase
MRDRAWFTVLALLGCADQRSAADGCDPGLTLPERFCARVFADEVGVARHIVVTPSGDVYVALEDASFASAGTTRMRGEQGRGGVVALRDTTGDGKSDVTVRFGREGGSGLALRHDTLWFSSPTTVYRYRLKPDALGVLDTVEVVVRGLMSGGHSSRSLALDDANALYVNVGSDSNVCMLAARADDPCRELETRAGIWRFQADGREQSYASAERFATGIRNAVGLFWDPATRALYATQHGRDNLGAHPGFSRQDNDDLPAEEFMRVQQGDDFGWPYCYYDWHRNQRLLAPEYGGDGRQAGKCASLQKPLIGFPGHWGPNGLLFYDGAMFPARYRGGAFIAFHGSWNRRKQDGYKVVFVPFAGGTPGQWEVFADGFAGRRKSPSGASHRPVGLAVAPDGSLYITDDQRGRVWNVRFTGAR